MERARLSHRGARASPKLVADECSELGGQPSGSGDRIEVTRGINTASVDLIYLDPPFNSNADYASPTEANASNAPLAGSASGCAY